MLPSSNMCAITRPATCTSMVGLAHKRSRSFIGSKFSADSSRHSFENCHYGLVTIMPLRMFFSFHIQPFVSCCQLTACPAFDMPECLTMFSTTNDARTRLPSSNMSAITRHTICASMVGLAHKRSRSFIGSKFSADSSRHSSENCHYGLVTIMPLRMFFSFHIQPFVSCCHLTACPALNAMQPQLVF